MPTRDFVVIPPNLYPGGLEITIDRHGAGFERTCHICRTVITRHEPGPDGGRRTIHRPWARMGQDIEVTVPGLTPYRLNLPVDVCGVCLPFMAAPFFPALVEQVDLSRIPTEILFALGLQLVSPADVDEHQGADVDHQGADVAEPAAAPSSPTPATAATVDERLSAAVRQLDGDPGADVDEAAPNSPAAPSSPTSTTAAAAELEDRDELAAV